MSAVLPDISHRTEMHSASEQAGLGALLAKRLSGDLGRTLYIGIDPADLPGQGIDIRNAEFRGIECLDWCSTDLPRDAKDFPVTENQRSIPASSKQNYETVVVKASIQTTDALVLFGRTYQWLHPAGRLLVIDSEASAATETAPCRELAQRCGFELLETANGPSAERHMDYCAVYIKKEPRRWRVSHISPEDLPALGALFQQAFGHGISPALWCWKYSGGRSRGAVVWKDQKIVAHYGIISRPIRYFNDAALCWQVADVMVSPKERGAMARQGPFFLTAASCADAYVGYGRRHLLGMGFPNARHMRLAETLGLYTCVDQMVEVRWKPTQRRSGLRFSCRDLRQMPSDKDAELVNRLWSKMERDLAGATVGVRDWDYVRYRYLQHPEIVYQVVLVMDRLLRRPVGIVVLNNGGEDCELLDIIGPLANIPELVKEARRLAAQCGGKGLFAWITRQHGERFAATGGELRPLDVSIPTSVWTPGPDPEQLKDKWWLMSGDTDFH